MDARQLHEITVLVHFWFNVSLGLAFLAYYAYVKDEDDDD